MRNWVFKALCAVLIDHEYSNLYLKNNLGACPAKDRALATRIYYGTLQNYTYLNYVISPYLRKKPSNKTMILLSMSTYQILFLDKVPRYAICNEAVQIAKKNIPSASGLVNAILRKIDKNNISLPQDEVIALSVIHSVPEWLVRMWISQYGMDTTKEILPYTHQILPTYVRANPMRIESGDFDTEEFTCVKKGLYTYNGDSIASHPYYLKGKMSVQDEGSYQIACFVDAKPNQIILDACAAPGTKTMAMAENMQNKGKIVAMDLHEHRVKLIDNDAKRLGITNVEAKCGDATKEKFFSTFDKVLCDVPCSGYGVLARKPDIKLNMKTTDMDTLIPLQYQILKNCSKYVRDKGELIYSTCTINKKENDNQIRRFLKEEPSFILLEEKTLFPSYGHDGFYMAKLVKANLDLV